MVSDPKNTVSPGAVVVLAPAGQADPLAQAAVSAVRGTGGGVGGDRGVPFTRTATQTEQAADGALASSLCLSFLTNIIECL